MSFLELNFGFTFDDLNDQKKLKQLDNLFLNFIRNDNEVLYSNFLQARAEFKTWGLIHSNLAIEIATYLEVFIAEFFNIQVELFAEKEKYEVFSKIYECKRAFIQRYALKSKNISYNSLESLSVLISENLNTYPIEMFEQIFSEYTLKWLKEEDNEKLNIAAQYALWACNEKEGQKKHKDGILFKFPHKIDFTKLVPVEELDLPNNIKTYNINKEDLKPREGFKLTDKGCESNFAADQSNYCIHCHNQQKDSCSKGIKEKGNGCPLDEKISEMNLLKSKGNILGSLAMAIVDNPMLAATGHRICNDCMKSCIYQKQDPVNIPQVETRVLKDVLSLPWGFEIYSLLTRWNPLSFDNFCPKEDTNSKILVVGMGPAGFTLAHYLLNEGHVVVGIDGLKIEPLEKHFYYPIKDINKYFEELDERVVAGFGGVMEYGITNRWNKNFLLLIRILLERSKNFKLFGGVRFGSNITPQQAFEMGFDHIALCMGAGSPRMLSIPNALAKGIRTASDFLMSLQLGKAYKKDSLTNLQIRMPVVVIGGGLTALDAATEALAYYPEFVEKFVKNFDSNIKLNEEERQISEEFLLHYKKLKEAENKLDVLKSLGGVRIVYRNNLEKAPSYRLNHEELTLGLKEGVEFIDNSVPTKIHLDEFSNVSGLEILQDGKKSFIPAKTILIAAGTVPNIVLAREYPDFFELEDGYFKQKYGEFFTYKNGQNAISFFGDLHPNYAGNVVKAMSSAKKGYKVISNLVITNKEKDLKFFDKLDDLLVARLVKIDRLTDNIVELIIKSPMAAQNFKPGQFFKLQNYYDGQTPLMEPLALTGAKVNKNSGEISTIVLEMGESSKLCNKLKLGKEIVLMGPTGSGTKIVGKNVMLIGGGLGNAVLFSIGQAYKRQNAKVIYFAGYKRLSDRYKVEEIEAASDKVIWSCEEGRLTTTREQDLSFKGNIIEAIIEYSKSNIEEFGAIDHIIVIGSDKMMHAVKKARNNVLKPLLDKHHKAVASINSPMQCMMKEICGQCIQRHIDPKTQVESYVFSCVNQDQDLDKVDFIHLNDRLLQNSLLEKYNKSINS